VLRLRATDRAGQVVRDLPVRHGQDPVELLRADGLEPTFTGAATGDDGHVVLGFTVVPGEQPHPHQRVAAYAVVLAEVGGARSVLLTSFVRTRRDGWWGLPGGGLDPGEDPVDGVLREVVEETGQVVVDVEPVTVVSAHWTGRAPHGRLEDFHAVRLVYRARCPRPGPPVVHDVGGTTAEAAWVPLDRLPTLPVLEWARPLIAGQVAGSGPG
jgi:8-oxo-dGTP pyrophosphatase MutT (NUDIX family)